MIHQCKDSKTLERALQNVMQAILKDRLLDNVIAFGVCSVYSSKPHLLTSKYDGVFIKLAVFSTVRSIMQRLIRCIVLLGVIESGCLRFRTFYSNTRCLFGVFVSYRQLSTALSLMPVRLSDDCNSLVNVKLVPLVFLAAMPNFFLADVTCSETTAAQRSAK